MASAATATLDVGFVVTTCIREKAHAATLVNCLQSIRRFHAGAPVVVVQDGVCAAAEVSLSEAKALATFWVPNPYPGSGEFGAARVAATFPAAADYIMYMHDSTALQRMLVPADVVGMAAGWMPLWYADKRWMYCDPCDALVEALLPQLDSLAAAQWRAAADSPQRLYVAFGCMGIGTPAAWKAIWGTGIKRVATLITTRGGRCAFERLLPYAAWVARVSPDVAPMTTSLCGDIFAHPCFEQHGCTRPWDDPAVPDTCPPVWKAWFGR